MDRQTHGQMPGTQVLEVDRFWYNQTPFTSHMYIPHHGWSARYWTSVLASRRASSARRWQQTTRKRRCPRQQQTPQVARHMETSGRQSIVVPTRPSSSHTVSSRWHWKDDHCHTKRMNTSVWSKSSHQTDITDCLCFLLKFFCSPVFLVLVLFVY